MMEVAKDERDRVFEERLAKVRAAILVGARFQREVLKATGLERRHVDRALQKLRQKENFTYSPKTGWSPPGELA